MKKIMISQPMAGKTEEEITATRERFLTFAKELDLEVVNTPFTDDWYKPEEMLKRGVANIPLAFLARSVENMTQCDLAYFAHGFEKARGCRIEHEIATAYGLQIIYDDGGIADAESS